MSNSESNQLGTFYQARRDYQKANWLCRLAGSRTSLHVRIKRPSCHAYPTFRHNQNHADHRRRSRRSCAPHGGRSPQHGRSRGKVRLLAPCQAPRMVTCADAAAVAARAELLPQAGGCGTPARRRRASDILSSSCPAVPALRTACCRCCAAPRTSAPLRLRSRRYVLGMNEAIAVAAAA